MEEMQTITYPVEIRLLPESLDQKQLLGEWKEKSFTGQTIYTFSHSDSTTMPFTPNKENEEPSGVIIRSTSNSSASGLVKKIRVDLQKTPWLHWQWKILALEQPPGTIESETTRPGDDFAARVYLIIDGGLLFWKTQAINYVWSRQQTHESTWPNPYAGRKAMMLAVRNHQDPIGIWVNEARNVRQDLRRIFGKDIRYIDAVAIMTDTDDAGGSTSAAYANLFFSNYKAY